LIKSNCGENKQRAEGRAYRKARVGYAAKENLKKYFFFFALCLTVHSH